MNEIRVRERPTPAPGDYTNFGYHYEQEWGGSNVSIDLKEVHDGADYYEWLVLGDPFVQHLYEQLGAYLARKGHAQAQAR